MAPGAESVRAANDRSQCDLQRVAVIIPAFNEERPLGTLLPMLRELRLGQVVVADNGSTDRTAEVVRAHGFDVVSEPRRGYGAACARGIEAVDESPDIIVFLDADLADDPTVMGALVEPIAADHADLVIGCRDSNRRESGSMTAAQRFGNWLATRLIRVGWGYRYRDLGPFRAIRRSSLIEMDMRDRAYGWTVEMQVRALQMGLRIEQVAVPYRRRLGVSKISGTFRGVILAGYYILTTIARLYFGRRV
ncbi:MAG: glycosyltransferase family 2 protein [Planctomycetes bacterium]|nr:glycosyltransferase family 2 protein [Planctomycetota bacterium]